MYLIANFVSDITLCVAKWANYPTADAELEAIASTLSGDLIVHDMTIRTPMPPLQVTPYQTAFTNDVNLIVNRGKAGNLSGPQMAAALSGATPSPLTPVNTSAPVISGNPVVAWRLACDPGAWSNNPTFAYQWMNDGSPISGQTGPNHVCTDLDAGAVLTCAVKATNDAGSGAALSNALTISQGPPVNFSPPIASLNPTYLLCTGGNWTGGAMQMSYQWYANGVLIGGATNSTWVFAGYEGQSAFCAVTVQNAYGTCPAVNTNSVQIPS